MAQEAGREIEHFHVDLSCDGQCEACEKFYDCDSPKKTVAYERRRIGRAKKTMSGIKHIIAVLAGKGGVGKSLTSSNLATALAMKGRKVSILDQDFDGPCIPKMLGVLGKKLEIGSKGIIPVEADHGIQVISTGSILKDDAVLTWFHQMRRNATEEFLAHVDYGKRDYLIIDLPPGTSSDSVNIMTFIPNIAGAIVVTIPPVVSQIVARRATRLCQKAKIKVFGIVENMSGFVCPSCGNVEDIMQTGGGEQLAKDTNVPFLGKIPLDPKLSESSDIGKPFVDAFPDSPASKAIVSIVDKIEKDLGMNNK